MEKKIQTRPRAAQGDTAALWGLGFLTAQLTPRELQAQKKPFQQLMESSATLFRESGVSAVKNLFPREFTAPKLFGAFYGLGSLLCS